MFSWTICSICKVRTGYYEKNNGKHWINPSELKINGEKILDFLKDDLDKLLKIMR